MSTSHASTREAERLNALHRLDLIHAPRDPVLDRATGLAARLLDMPVSLVTLVDASRQWFKAGVGVDLLGTPRAHSFCAHAIEADEVMVVPDLVADDRFADNPFVAQPPHVRFYAGAPIRTIDGYSLGTLCVMSREPQPDFGSEQTQTLVDLAALVSGWVRMRESAGYLDAATGIFTRQRLLETLGTALRRSPTAGDSHASLLGVVDVAMPRQMHDLIQVLGYQHTERFIAECIERLADALGHAHPIYRIGLFRFGVLLREQPDERTRDGLYRLMKTLRQPFDSEIGILLAPDTVMGVTRIDAGDEADIDAAEILRRASAAADDAWESDCCWCYYEPAGEARRQRRVRLLTDLRSALEAGDELYLEYQPKVDVARGDCVGVEALLRWQHPVLGFVSPAELIDAAERTALMRPLTDWVLDTALAQNAAWRRRGLTLPVAVNLSAHDIADEAIVERVDAHLRRHALPGDSLEVEFTESTLIDDLDAAVPRLEQLHAIGVTTAIDDFGTGYCNLAYLQKLNAGKIKIDRRFVQTLDRDERGQVLTRAIVRLAHDLDYRIVAEGVENQATLRLLLDWGCEQAQGYLFARPLSADALHDWVRSSEPVALS